MEGEAMKKVFFWACLVTSISVFPSCGDKEELVRCGAVCNDRTTTCSTGRGTCSSHDGVRSWVHYNNNGECSVCSYK